MVCTQTRCIHCQGDHMSNDMKCPKVKQYRAELTKLLLSSATPNISHPNYFNMNQTDCPPMQPTEKSTIVGHTTNNMTWLRNNITSDNYNNLHHYHHSSPYNTIGWSYNTSATNSMVTKIDKLVNSMHQVNTLLEKIATKHDQFEEFMLDKIESDKIISNKIGNLHQANKDLSANITQHEIKILTHENICTKVIFPLLEEISTFITNINTDKYGKSLDADCMVKINRMRSQMNNTRTSKDF
ncbi:unnamed protein product [Rotaria magnacalcarata]|uniref:Uncharacterized protein n=2 Tax=Rotaria magnacalcarata TaxID=392030 RepID=A0A8S2WN23_9BILA|nr:unnamed protein product [Rotaria magnacalcarata]